MSQGTLTSSNAESPTLFGHPTGLFNLFFAEMWERFSYYGMRALLVFYMTKGFLGYGDGRANSVYGAYTALVYMTPFIGGMLADRLLGQRLSVIIGGVLMAIGHLLMGINNSAAFYVALSLLIVGNGFFKPNISTMVGELYPAGSKLKDGGFTIFYMGVNLGGAMSPLLCGYIGEKYGWHYGFGLATLGMIVGLAVFVVPNFITQFLIGVGALAVSISLMVYRPDNTVTIIMHGFCAACVAAAGIISIFALARGGLPSGVGRRPEGPATMGQVGMVLGGILVAIPIITMFVSGFSLLRSDGSPLVLISSELVDKISTFPGGKILSVFAREISTPAGLMLGLTGLVSFGYLIIKTGTLDTVARHRMVVALIMIFFSFLFWAFFEQAGSSLNMFADRNVDRVSTTRLVTEDQVGSVIKLQPTQEQLGYTNGEKVFTLDQLTALRNDTANAENPAFEIEWKVASDNVGMGIADRNQEVAASSFQAINSICILVFGLVFSSLWTWTAAKGIEPSTPVKFALGLIQLGLGFGAFWLGASICDSRGMVGVVWLILGYVLHSTGELCLSPVGLSMITRLSPKILVSTMMGAWFLATALSQYLAGIISQFTGVEHSGGDATSIPVPKETVGVYGNVWGLIAIAAIVSGFVCLLLSPMLKAWTHPEAPEDHAGGRGGH